MLLPEIIEEKILFVHDADDGVDGIFIDGDPRISAGSEDFFYLVGRGFYVHGGNIHAGDENVAHFQIVELDDRTDQFGFFLVQSAAFPSLFDDGHDLVFRDDFLVL